MDSPSDCLETVKDCMLYTQSEGIPMDGSSFVLIATVCIIAYCLYIVVYILMHVDKYLFCAYYCKRRNIGGTFDLAIWQLSI